METIIALQVNVKHEGNTVYQFLKNHDLSTTLIRDLKREGRIYRNNQVAYADEIVHEGDLIELFLPGEGTESLLPEPVLFDILYEDDDLLIVNKPAGVVVHPTYNQPNGTLGNGVVHYWRERGKNYRFRPFNRIDKDTSGIVVIPLHLFSYNRLAAQQARGEIQKIYLACVHGVLSLDHGIIQANIARKEDSIIEREVRQDGQEAITSFQVVERYQNATLVKLQLLTGRTHQIRVHMQYLGHPLIGDDLYGGSKTLIKRQALHAMKIHLHHPRTDEQMSIQAPLPEDMCTLIHLLQRTATE